MGRAKGKGRKSEGKGEGPSSQPHANGKKVGFEAGETIPAPVLVKPKGGLKPSPSMNTLSRLDREKIVLWRRPLTTLYYAAAELICITTEFLTSLLRYRLFLATVMLTSGVATYFYLTPGAHQAFVTTAEAKLLWWSWWVFLGVLSSIGLGSGLHTFLLYLGPHIASVTLAAFECSSLDFPEPPYPESIVCPGTKAAYAITLWNIVKKVRVEAFLWGVGTAIGELPPYFMARAARLSGNEPEDEEYKEFLELLHGNQAKHEMSWMDRGKAWIESTVAKVGFFGILACASIPNPFFDLAGITCGHFLVPFWTFFGATVIGKAIVKMHVQMLFVIVIFSEHHVEHALSLLKSVPHGDQLRTPIRDFFNHQKKSLHRVPGEPVVQKSNLLGDVMGVFVSGMIIYFLLSLLNGLAQSYHKRLYERTKVKQN